MKTDNIVEDVLYAQKFIKEGDLNKADSVFRNRILPVVDPFLRAGAKSLFSCYREDGYHVLTLTAWRSVVKFSGSTSGDFMKFFNTMVRNEKLKIIYERRSRYGSGDGSFTPMLPGARLSISDEVGEGCITEDFLSDDRDCIEESSFVTSLDNIGDRIPDLDFHVLKLLHNGYNKVEIAGILGIPIWNVHRVIKRLAKSKEVKELLGLKENEERTVLSRSRRRISGT